MSTTPYGPDTYRVAESRRQIDQAASHLMAAQGLVRQITEQTDDSRWDDEALSRCLEELGMVLLRRQEVQEVEPAVVSSSNDVDGEAEQK